MNNAALVVGGGIAGMTAALALAEQGFPVHLVEKTERAGRHGPAASPHARRPGRAGVSWPRRIERVDEPSRRSPSICNAACRQGRTGTSASFTSDASSTERRRPTRGQARGGRRGHRRHGAEAADVTATARAREVLTQLELSDRLGRGEICAARAGHGRHDPVRRAAERRAALLQPRLLHHGGEECAGT